MRVRKTWVRIFFHYILYALLQEEKSSWQKKVPGPWKLTTTIKEIIHFSSANLSFARNHTHKINNLPVRERFPSPVAAELSLNVTRPKH